MGSDWRVPSSCRRELPLSAADSRRVVDGAEYPRECARPSELDCGFNKVSIQSATFVNLFTKGEKKELNPVIVPLSQERYVHIILSRGPGLYSDIETNILHSC